MQIITTKQLRDNLAEILEKVAIGRQSFQIMKFGKVKAKMIPVSISDKERISQVSDQPLEIYWGQYSEQKPIKQKKMVRKRIDFKKLPAFGMWRDREDMKDSAKWVRELRIKNSYRIRDE